MLPAVLLYIYIYIYICIYIYIYIYMYIRMPFQTKGKKIINEKKNIIVLIFD